MIGETVGSYRIVAPLGEGGMGTVYLAEHSLIGRRVAVKVLLPQYSHNATIVQRFFNEARSTAMLQHPGLVDVFDFGYLPSGRAFLVMEYLAGETLSALLRRVGRPGTALVVEVARQIALALEAAHARGIVHRDLKPENVFLVAPTDFADGLRVKVLDFGIAKLTAEEAGSVKTRTGSLLGTPTYMSPEQARGSGHVDARADIYSLGCILYEMVSGQPPFSGEGPGEVIAKQIFEATPPLRALVPELPPQLEAIIVRALAKKPSERQANMGELARELGALLPATGRPAMPSDTPAAGTPQSAPPMRTTLNHAAGETRPAAPLPSRRRARSLAVVLALAAGVATVAATIGVVRVARMNRATKERRVAAAGSLPTVAGENRAPSGAAPSLIQLTIESSPPGAEVVRVADGSRLGRTPLVTERPVGTAKMAFRLLLDGYREEIVSLDGDRDGTARARLVPTAAVAPSHPAPASAKKTARRRGAISKYRELDPFSP